MSSLLNDLETRGAFGRQFRETYHAAKPTAATPVAEGVRSALWRILTERIDGVFRNRVYLHAEELIETLTEDAFNLVAYVQKSVEQSVVVFCGPPERKRSLSQEEHASLRSKCWERCVEPLMPAVENALRELESRQGSRRFCRVARYWLPPLLNICPSWLVRGTVGRHSWRRCREVAEYIEIAVNAIGAMVETLVNEGYLGYVLYRDDEQGSAGYSYVVRRIVCETEERTVEKPEQDSRELPGERVEYTMHTERLTRRTEEHIHHLRNAQHVAACEYRESLPERVERLRQTEPEWLSPWLRVTSGTIVQEDIHEYDEVTTERSWQTREVVKRSPALTLDDVVLIGWSEDDFKPDPVAEQYRLNQQEKERKRRQAAEAALLGAGLVVAAAPVAVVAAVGYGIWRLLSGIFGRD